MKVRALINSRIFGAKIENEANDSIVPYADMFNYKYKTDMTHWSFSVEDGTFIVKARNYIPAGSEIFVYYGNKPNSSFFQFYGFVVENNDNDDVCFELSIDSEDPLMVQKMALTNRKYSDRRFKVNNKTDHEKFKQMMSYIRYIVFKGNYESLKEVS